MNEGKTLVNDMSQGPVLKSLIRFAIPMMLANLLQAVYSMVDMIVVGQFGGRQGCRQWELADSSPTCFWRWAWAFPMERR